MISRNQHCQGPAVAKKKRLGSRSAVTMHLKMGQASTILPFLPSHPLFPTELLLGKNAANPDFYIIWIKIKTAILNNMSWCKIYLYILFFCSQGCKRSDQVLAPC